MKLTLALLACLVMLSACHTPERRNTGPTLYPNAEGGSGHGGNTGSGTR